MVATTIEDSVKQRAFELYAKRGGIHGNDKEDWFQAEKEVHDHNDTAKQTSDSTAGLDNSKLSGKRKLT